MPPAPLPSSSTRFDQFNMHKISLCLQDDYCPLKLMSECENTFASSPLRIQMKKHYYYYFPLSCFWMRIQYTPRRKTHIHSPPFYTISEARMQFYYDDSKGWEEGCFFSLSKNSFGGTVILTVALQNCTLCHAADNEKQYGFVIRQGFLFKRGKILYVCCGCISIRG